MQPYKPKVYTASKIRHQQRWQGTAMAYQDAIEFTARWVWAPPGPDYDTTFWTDGDKVLHWIQDVQDVQRSDYLIAYCDKGDEVRGTLVEIGMAIAFCKVVIAVGFDGAHSWQAHPSVIVRPTIAEALSFITGGPK